MPKKWSQGLNEFYAQTFRAEFYEVNSFIFIEFFALLGSVAVAFQLL